MSHSEAHDHPAVGHVAPLRALIGTGIALLFLTWITVFVAEFDLGEFNVFVALAIATLKATLVGLFFMHLRWDRPFNAVVCVSSIAFVALFIALAITDSAEYQDQIKPGDAPAVVTTIAENAGDE